MKKIFLPLAILMLAGCNNKKDEDGKKDKTSGGLISATEENSIVGVWRPYEMKIGEMTNEERKEILEKATIEFTAGGSYISHFDEEGETGSYTYNDKEKTLITRSPDNDEERFTVKWEDGLLRLTNEEGEMVLKRK
ncbi:MAG: hypothetical protein ACT4OJ_11265 [Bacteroidota bacterium]